MVQSRNASTDPNFSIMLSRMDWAYRFTMLRSHRSVRSVSATEIDDCRRASDICVLACTVIRAGKMTCDLDQRIRNGMFFFLSSFLIVNMSGVVFCVELTVARLETTSNKPTKS